MLNKNKYKPNKILVFDTETTGVFGAEIIELAFCIYDLRYNKVIETFDTFVKVKDNLDTLMTEIKKPDGTFKSISELTHITNEMCKSGITQEELANIVQKKFFDNDTMLVGYNLNFDLNRVKETLERFGKVFNIKNIDCLDLLTVYKDRAMYDRETDSDGRPLGHRLDSAVKHYKVKVKNTHRAIDDVLATLEVYKEMEKEEKISPLYKNSFGFNAKFSDSLERLNHIEYYPQSYSKKSVYYQLLKGFKEYMASKDKEFLEPKFKEGIYYF